MGHIAEKGLRELHGKGMVEGIFDFSLDFNFFEHCIYGKQNESISSIINLRFSINSNSLRLLSKTSQRKSNGVLRIDNGEVLCGNELQRIFVRIVE